MKKTGKIFAVGGGIYVLLEILYKGGSHLSMFLAGGTALVGIDAMDRKWMKNAPLLGKMLVGSLWITSIEFFTGFLVNRCFHRNEWDYSQFRGNICGQICPLFTILWAMLTLPAIWVCRRLGRLQKGRDEI